MGRTSGKAGGFIAAALILWDVVLLALGVRLGKSSSQRAVEAKANADGVQRQGLDSLREGRSVSDYLSPSPGTPHCPTGAREGSHARADISPCFSSCSSCRSLPSLRRGQGQIWPVPSATGPACISHSHPLWECVSHHLVSPCIRSPPAWAAVAILGAAIGPLCTGWPNPLRMLSGFALTHPEEPRALHSLWAFGHRNRDSLSLTALISMAQSLTVAERLKNLGHVEALMMHPSPWGDRLGVMPVPLPGSWCPAHPRWELRGLFPIF